MSWSVMGAGTVHLLCSIGRCVGLLSKVSEVGGDKAKVWGDLESPHVEVSQPLLSPLSPQLSSLTRARQEALSSLTNKAEGLEKSLNSLETRRAAEAKELAVAQKEAELLRKQLR